MQEAGRAQAALNKQLQAQLSAATTWESVANIIEQHTRAVNHITLGQAVLRLGLLVRADAGPDTHGDTNTTVGATTTGNIHVVSGARYEALLQTLAQLVTQQASWFTAQQYSQVQ